MKKTLFAFALLPFVALSQLISVQTNGSKLRSNKQLTLFLDEDTNSYVSQLNVTYDQLMASQKFNEQNFHSEFPFGPYGKNIYKNLPEYTPTQLVYSLFTTFDQKLNYSTLNYFNQVPIKKEFKPIIDRWNDSIYNHLIETHSNVEITSGVIYGKKTFARVKIPIYYYSIFITDKDNISIWIMDTKTGALTGNGIASILQLAEENKNSLKLSLKPKD